MALVIEDGTIVEGANSYVTVEQCRAYAAARKATLPDAAEDLKSLLVRSMDFLEAQADRYKGVRTRWDQPLQWPRSLVYVDNYQIGFNSIPALLQNAQCQVAIEINQGSDPQQTSSGAAVVREKVDTLEVEYERGQVASPAPKMRKVEGFLRPLMSRKMNTVTRI